MKRWDDRARAGLLALAGALALTLAVPAGAQPAPRATATRGGTDAATNQVSIRIEGDYRVITANGWPDHVPGKFPRRGNPNTASPQNYTFRVPLKPVTNGTPVRRGGWFFGVALNGVPFEPGTAETWNNDPRSPWRYEAHTGFLNLGLDEHNAHVQPTGAYHYHAMPTGLVQRLGGDSNRMLLVGWAADGFPIYTAVGHTDPKDGTSPLRQLRPSYRLRQGERPVGADGPVGKYDGRFTQDFEFVKNSGDLDDSNGRIAVTPEFPAGTYAYHITDEFPFLPRQWHGTPDASFGKGGGAPGTGPAGAGRQRGGAGGGPAGGPPSPLSEALDANGDGIIDATELKAAIEALKSLDANGDGQLTPDEYQPARRGPGGGPGGGAGPGGGRPPARGGPGR